MKSKQNRDKPKSTRTDTNDDFLKLMKQNGVTRLDRNPDPKPTPAAPGSEPIVFVDTSDWNPDTISPAEKFSGKPSLPRRLPPKKLKITRDFSPDDTLDLHGETRENALSKVKNAIHTSEHGSYQALLIITGKGINSQERGGVLGKAVWSWLADYQIDHPIRFQWAPPFLGGKGAILVIF